MSGLAADSLPAAIQRLRLPIPDSSVAAAAEAAGRTLGSYDPADRGRVLLNELAAWKRTGTPSQLLKEVIRTALTTVADGDERTLLLASSYFKAHAELQRNELLSFDQASAVLSHALLIADLATAEHLSASQVARILRPLDERADVHWQAVQRVLRKMRLYQALEPGLVDTVWEADEAAEPILFGDAGVEDAALIVGEAGADLGFSGDLRGLLLTLVSPTLEMHGPYLRMLFFQGLIAERFDHALTVIYEFSPRGNVAARLFNDRLADLPGAMNAFLNNAKGRRPP